MTPEDKKKVKDATIAALDKAGTTVDVSVHPDFGKGTVRELMLRALEQEETYDAIARQVSLKKKYGQPGATLEGVIADLTSDSAIKWTIETFTNPPPGMGALPPRRAPKGPSQ